MATSIRFSKGGGLTRIVYSAPSENLETDGCSTVLTLHCEQLTGPDDWFLEKDREFESLAEKLSFATPRVVEFIEKIHGNYTRLDGTQVLEHLERVSDRSGKLAEAFFESLESVNERYYFILISRYAALLHESLPFSGSTYEAIAALTDKTTADCVSSLTPNLSEPFNVRIEHLVNKIGRCGVVSQLVKLVDLVDDGIMYEKLVTRGGVVNLYDCVYRYVFEVEAFLRNFNHIDKHPRVKRILTGFSKLIPKLQKYMEDIDASSSKKNNHGRKRT